MTVCCVFVFFVCDWLATNTSAGLLTSSAGCDPWSDRQNGWKNGTRTSAVKWGATSHWNEQMERKIGTNSWNDKLERKIGTKNWIEKLERKIGTKNRNEQRSDHPTPNRDPIFCVVDFCVYLSHKTQEKIGTKNWIGNWIAQFPTWIQNLDRACWPAGRPGRAVGRPAGLLAGPAGRAGWPAGWPAGRLGWVCRPLAGWLG